MAEKDKRTAREEALENALKQIEKGLLCVSERPRQI